MNETKQLTERQKDTIQILTRLISDKSEEKLWNDCYYDGDDKTITDLLGKLQSEGVEINFGVKLTPYHI